MSSEKKKMKMTMMNFNNNNIDEDLKNNFLKYLGQTSDSPYLLEIEKADGIYLYSPKGEKYIDLISGVSVSSLGHNSPIIKEAILKQVTKHLHLMVYGEFIQEAQVNLAEYLVHLLPEKLNNVYFINSGSEAIEAAIKLAKKFTHKQKIFALNNAYHGSTAGALSLCGNDDFKSSSMPLLSNVNFIDINNYDDIEKIDNDTACVVMEPIQAEGGIRIAEKNWVQKLHNKCKENAALLIFDEIQTGFGRCGKMFCFEHFDIVPDIVCFAKALGGGMPLGALAAPQSIMASFKNNPVLGHITTFGGHPVSCAASLATLKYINDNNIVDSVEEKSFLFKKLLVHPKIKEIRGFGLLLAVELNNSTEIQRLIKIGLETGFVTDWFIFHDTAFRIAPPLTITKDEIKIACDLILNALNNL